MRSGPGDVLAEDLIFERIPSAEGAWKRLSSAGPVGTWSINACVRRSVSQSLGANIWR